MAAAGLKIDFFRVVRDVGVGIGTALVFAELQQQAQENAVARAERAAGSPVSGLVVGTSIAHWLAIAFTSASL